MKYILSLCCAVISAFIIISFLPVNGEEALYDNVIRLHVIADSDSEEDQAIKLRVRDRIIAEIGDRGGDSFEEAYSSVSQMLPEIEQAAADEVSKYTNEYTASVILGEEVYPERIYEDISLPAGKYMSLRVVLGSGEGKNWWCVLFPPLCTSAAEKEEDFVAAGISSEGYRMIKNEHSPKYRVRFKILEVLSGIFGYEY